MKKISRVKAALAMLLLAGLVLAIAGCGAEAKLVGKWVPESGEYAPSDFFDNFEFSKNGTGEGEGYTITWKVEKKHLVITVWGDVVTYDFEISGGKLTLTDEDGKKAVYKKVKK